MRNIFYVTLILCLFATTANAQQWGAPSSTSFNTGGTGGQIGHLQTGTFGNVSGSGNSWIGIGQPNIGPAAYGMRIQDGNNFCTLDIQNGQSEIFWGGSTSNDFNFGYASNATTPATNIMTLKANGRVGIGTANPSRYFEIVNPNGLYTGMVINTLSNAYSSSLDFKNNNGFWHLSGPRSFDPSNNFSIFWNNNSVFTRYFTIEDNGNVGIGIANPSVKLHVNGTIKTNLSTINSDRRYKDKIETLANPMELLNTINGVSYEYKRGEFPEQDFKEGKSLGFVAQDFEKALPELLIKDEKGFYAVNYDGVIPILVEAMKEVKSENGALKTTNDNLASELTTLKTTNDNLASELTTLKTTNDNLANELTELKALVKDLIKAQDVNNNVDAKKQSLNGSDAKSILFQNVPNPSNGMTKIAYQVNNATANVSIVLNNVGGAEISRFDNLPTGKQSVDLTENLSNGIYLYTLYVDGIAVATKRLVISK